MHFIPNRFRVAFNNSRLSHYFIGSQSFWSHFNTVLNSRGVLTLAVL